MHNTYYCFQDFVHEVFIGLCASNLFIFKPYKIKPRNERVEVFTYLLIH